MIASQTGRARADHPSLKVNGLGKHSVKHLIDLADYLANYLS
jgi:hypothetical protein